MVQNFKKELKKILAQKRKKLNQKILTSVVKIDIEMLVKKTVILSYKMRKTFPQITIAINPKFLLHRYKLITSRQTSCSHNEKEGVFENYLIHFLKLRIDSSDT